MKALTLYPEWAYAVDLFGKDIENRTWAPGFDRGELFAIHAGARVGGGRCGPEEALRRVIEMAARAGVDAGRFFRETPIECSAIVAVVEFRGVVADSSSPWAVPGQRHWWIRRVGRLARPVPCRGAQGLWTVPEPVLRTMRRHWQKGK